MIRSRICAAGAILASLLGAAGAHGQELIRTSSGPGFLIHGNYCGPGNRGPGFRPIDALDLACAHHDACWPTAPAALASCACNARLYREAGRVARDPREADRTRRTAQFIADFASTIPCDGPAGPPAPVIPPPRRPAAR